MMLIYSKETPEIETSSAAMKEIAAGHRAVMGAASSSGVFLTADKLKPTGTATTVRQDGGRAVVTDGPFAETKEQLAGYYILECRDLDEAIQWAARIPTGCSGADGCIEIRPIVEIHGRG